MDQGLLTNKDLSAICPLLPKLCERPNSERYRLSVLLTWSSVAFSRLSKDQEMQITIFPFKHNCHFTVCFPTGKKLVPLVPIRMHSTHKQLHGTYHCPLWRRALIMARQQQNPQCHSAFSVVQEEASKRTRSWTECCYICENAVLENAQVWL